MLKWSTLFAAVCLMTLLQGVSLGPMDTVSAEEVPSLRVGYVFSTHHAPLIAALAKGEAFRDRGIYLKPLVPKEKYALFENGKKLANLDIIVNKSSAEATTLFAMNRLDLAMASITAVMSGVDRGSAVKVLCPLHTDGMGLVFPKGSKVTGWDGLMAHIRGSRRPVTIGYHSPTSAPKVILEGALASAGVRVTENPNDPKAQVVLVDLKTTGNFMSALISRQVDAWVGPAPYPQVAEVQNIGKVVLDLKDFPPKGQWHNFPCCVMAARDEVIAKHPAAVKALVGLMQKSADWCNTHKDEASSLTGAWIGTPAEAVRRSGIVYTTTPSKNWMRGVEIYLETLNRLKDFSGKLVGKTLEQVRPLLLDLRYAPKKG